MEGTAWQGEQEGKRFPFHLCVASRAVTGSGGVLWTPSAHLQWHTPARLRGLKFLKPPQKGHQLGLQIYEFKYMNLWRTFFSFQAQQRAKVGSIESTAFYCKCNYYLHSCLYRFPFPQTKALLGFIFYHLVELLQKAYWKHVLKTLAEILWIHRWTHKLKKFSKKVIQNADFFCLIVEKPKLLLGAGISLLTPMQECLQRASISC